MNNAQVHRFGDRVAVSLPGKGQTVYLTASEAKQLAKALNACSRNVKEQPQFSQCNFTTVHIETSNPLRS